MTVLSFYRSQGSYKTIYRLCWKHADLVLAQLLALKGGRP